MKFENTLFSHSHAKRDIEDSQVLAFSLDFRFRRRVRFPEPIHFRFTLNSYCFPIRTLPDSSCHIAHPNIFSNSTKRFPGKPNDRIEQVIFFGTLGGHDFVNFNNNLLSIFFIDKHEFPFDPSDPSGIHINLEFIIIPT